MRTDEARAARNQIPAAPAAGAPTTRHSARRHRRHRRSAPGAERLDGSHPVAPIMAVVSRGERVLDSTAKTLRQGHCWLVSQLPPGEVDVGYRMADVAGPRRTMHGI